VPSTLILFALSKSDSDVSLTLLPHPYSTNALVAEGSLYS
jgi:hypothetical protein